MPTYAKDTAVPSERSRAEIERTLERYGATAFMYGWAAGRAVIGFEAEGRRYRLLLPLPDKTEFARTPGQNRPRTQEGARAAYEQAVRQRWRALALWVKAMLEGAEAGIITLQEALQPFLVLPDGRTVGEWLSPQIEAVYRNGQMPPMLPGPTETRD
jgi:hypothetical protein